MEKEKQDRATRAAVATREHMRRMSNTKMFPISTHVGAARRLCVLVGELSALKSEARAAAPNILDSIAAVASWYAYSEREQLRVMKRDERKTRDNYEPDRAEEKAVGAVG